MIIDHHMEKANPECSHPAPGSDPPTFLWAGL
jgi:hypothetical protein